MAKVAYDKRRIYFTKFLFKSAVGHAIFFP